MSLYPIGNSIDHTFEILLHFRIRETKEPDTEFLNFALPLAVSLELPLVRITIDFNNQKQPRAEEIDYKFINRLLSMEVVSRQLFVLELVPKKNLSESHVVAKHSRDLR